MIFFLIKKTFFDMWDNLLRIIIFNIISIGLFLGIFLLASLFKGYDVLLVILSLIGVAIFMVFSTAVSLYIKEITDYKKPGILDFISYLKKSWLTGLFLFAALVVFFIISNISFPFWASLKHIGGYIIFCILVWAGVFFVLSIQYFLPIYSRMNNNPLKTLKKCFLVFIDNPLFSIILFIGSIIIMIISALTLFMMPGFSTVLLWLNAGTKLRLYKYDYLELHPEALRKKIPWKELLVNDMECVGKRSFKNLIFPWKD
jgi:hypothetical protein